MRVFYYIVLLKCLDAASIAETNDKLDDTSVTNSAQDEQTVLARMLEHQQNDKETDTKIMKNATQKILPQFFFDSPSGENDEIYHPPPDEDVFFDDFKRVSQHTKDGNEDDAEDEELVRKCKSREARLRKFSSVYQPPPDEDIIIANFCRRLKRSNKNIQKSTADEVNKRVKEEVDEEDNNDDIEDGDEDDEDKTVERKRRATLSEFLHIDDTFETSREEYEEITKAEKALQARIGQIVQDRNEEIERAVKDYERRVEDINEERLRRRRFLYDDLGHPVDLGFSVESSNLDILDESYFAEDALTEYFRGRRHTPEGIEHWSSQDSELIDGFVDSAVDEMISSTQDEEPQVMEARKLFAEITLLDALQLVQGKISEAMDQDLQVTSRSEVTELKSGLQQLLDELDELN